MKSRSRKSYQCSKLTDTQLKRTVLVIGMISAVNALMIALKAGMSVFSTILIGILQLLVLWLTLYQLTCFRDGGCNAFSVLVGVLTIMSSLFTFLLPSMYMPYMTS